MSLAKQGVLDTLRERASRVVAARASVASGRPYGTLKKS
jgi:hypothetical protein